MWDVLWRDVAAAVAGGDDGDDQAGSTRVEGGVKVIEGRQRESVSVDGAAPDVRAVGLGEVLRRAVSLRCALCGRGRLFRGLLRMEPRCSACGFRFERAPGYFLGSTYINYGLTAGFTTAAYVVLHFGMRVSNQILLPALLLFCGIFPVVFFRYARSLWLSLDCWFDRTGAEDSVAGFADQLQSRKTPETED